MGVPTGLLKNAQTLGSAMWPFCSHMVSLQTRPCEMDLGYTKRLASLPPGFQNSGGELSRNSGAPTKAHLRRCPFRGNRWVSLVVDFRRQVNQCHLCFDQNNQKGHLWSSTFSPRNMATDTGYPQRKPFFRVPSHRCYVC